MNTKSKEGAGNKGNPYFLRAPWNKRDLVNMGPVLGCAGGNFLVFPLKD